MAQCADVGSSITFTCNAKAVPSQNFTWIRQERVETVNHGGRFSIVSTLGSSQLIVKNVSVADRGYYACDATMSSLQQNEAVFYFQVPCSGKLSLVINFSGIRFCNRLSIFVHMQFKKESFQFTHSRKHISKILDNVHRNSFTCD